MAVSTASKMFALVVLSIIGGVLFVLMRYDGGGAGDASAAEGEVITVEIPEGATADDVGEILVDAGVIDRALTFQAVTRVDARASQIQPGTYELRAGMDTGEILERLTQSAEVEVFTVTIPEGLTVDQTLRRIAEAEASPFTADELRDALAGVALPAWVPGDLPDDAEPFEGLLAPNTYEFRADIDAQDMLNELVSATDATLQELGVDEGDRYDTLIIASLIEREVRVPEEQRTVSSVIRNRLRKDQTLNIDAAVRYATALDGGKAEVDTDIDSPWNTYQNTGLPPTPIAAPGRAAIEAAVDPADTNFVYYVVCDVETGAHAFTRTLDDHNRNVARYREIAGDQTGSYCDEAA
ncbi:MAG TPA: endolytic transglycosylase MltG [Euzebyales bacterium]|nr:endolytic transglycosylase MltG [Euzebyales bacterium]